MSDQGAIAKETRDILAEALASGEVTGKELKKGQAILERMDTPLRLSVMGLPGSGKTTMMNLLLGQKVFDPQYRLPTVSMVYGDTVSVKCTMPSGRVDELDSVDLAAIAAKGSAFVEIAMPLPALRKLSMMEVVAGKEDEQMRPAIRWAGRRTDIGLWCTDRCAVAEERLWELLPDHVQDHSFLVVTKVDALGADGSLRRVVSAAEKNGRDYFRKVLPIATQVALDARREDGTVDKSSMKASGGIALISAILKEVEAGQAANKDAADFFLAEIGYDVTSAAPKDVVAESAPKAETPKASAAPAEETPAEPKAAQAAEAVERQAAAVDQAVATDEADEDRAVDERAAKRAKSVTIKVPRGRIARKQAVERFATAAAGAKAKAKAAARTNAMSEAARTLCEQAVEQLTAEGAALAQHLKAGNLDPANVIEVSVDTVTWLADYLDESDASKEPAMARTCATATDAADLVQLIQLEKGDTVALDALSVMIQLKHEIQAELAA